MQFYNDSAFIFLLAVPAALALFWLRGWSKARKLGKFADSEILPKIAEARARDKEILKIVLILISILLMTLALARPQWGEEKKKVERKGIDIVFMLDSSLSMLAQDIKPSRFDKAKIEIRNFVKKLKGDRIGLVIFAGQAFLQAPLTVDYGAFLLFLDAVKVGYVPDPGSSLAEAIKTGLKAFPKGDKKYRVMIIFSDGEETTLEAEAVMERAREAGVRIYTVGVGTREGAPIPLGPGKGNITGFKKDRMGKTVISKLDNGLLEKIADETGGLFFPSTPGEKEIDLIYTHLGGIGKKTFKAKDMVEKEEHFQLFLLPALVLLMLELLISDRRKAGLFG